MAKYDKRHRRTGVSACAEAGPRDWASRSARRLRSSPAPRRGTPATQKEKRPARWAARRPSTTRSQGGRRRSDPQGEEARRSPTTQRADFEKATQRYAVGEEVGRGLSRLGVPQRRERVQERRRREPRPARGALQPGRRAAECGNEDAPVRIWEGHDLRPGHRQPRLLAWKRRRPHEAESLFNKAIEVDPLHTVEARNNLAQILRDKARRASEPDEKKQYVQPGRQQPAHRARDRQQQPAGVLDAGVHLLRHEHARRWPSWSATRPSRRPTRSRPASSTRRRPEEAAEGKAAKGKKGSKEGQGQGQGGDDSRGRQAGARRSTSTKRGTGVTARDEEGAGGRATTRSGLVELKKKNISPAIGQFKKAVAMNPKLRRGAPQPGGPVAQQPRLQHRGGELHARCSSCSRRTTRPPSASASRCAGTRRSTRRRRSTTPPRSSISSSPWSYFNLGLLYQDYKDGQKPALHKAQDYYRQFLGHANDKTPDVVQARRREAHQGHRRNLRRPRRGREDAGRGRGDAEEGRRAAEADGRADEEAGGRRGRRRRSKAKRRRSQGAAPAGARRLPAPGAGRRATPTSRPPRLPRDDQAGRQEEEEAELPAGSR